jgi:hypothetical protein
MLVIYFPPGSNASLLQGIELHVPKKLDGFPAPFWRLDSQRCRDRKWSGFVSGLGLLSQALTGRKRQLSPLSRNVHLGRCFPPVWPGAHVVVA